MLCSEPHTRHSYSDDAKDQYMLVEKNAKDKGFVKRLDLAVSHFVAACEGDVLHDESLMKTLTSWVTVLSTSAVRAFRHTCTHIGLQLGKAFIGCHNASAEEQSSLQRQLAAETKKTKGKKTAAAASGKMAALTERLEGLDAEVDGLWELVEGLYSGVIVHRYRDVAEPIRALAVRMLGEYVCALPSKLLDDKYLKYIGWTVNDKHHTVRKTALEALLQIYQMEDQQDALGLFTQRFKARLVNMCEDASHEVTAAAIEFAILLADRDALEVEEVASLQELVFSTDLRVRRAAGHFLHATLVATDIVNVALGDEAEEGTTVDPKLVLKYLANHAVTAAPLYTGVRADYMVDALWGHTEVLQDWEAYHALFEQDVAAADAAELAADDATLTADEELMLMRIMAAAAQRGCGALAVIGARRAVPSRATADAKEALSTFFAPRLPALFAKFGSTPDKALALTRVAELLELAAYTENRCVKQLDQLLKVLQEMVLKNSDLGLIVAAVETIGRFPFCNLHLQHPRSSTNMAPPNGLHQPTCLLSAIGGRRGALCGRRGALCGRRGALCGRRGALCGRSGWVLAAACERAPESLLEHAHAPPSRHVYVEGFSR
jgi:cohesin complex subunit SA-1/2